MNAPKQELLDRFIQKDSPNLLREAIVIERQSERIETVLRISERVAAINRATDAWGLRDEVLGILKEEGGLA